MFLAINVFPFLFVTGVKMAALLERDTDFCSGEDEEDLDADIHSPTDASEDSVEVRVKPITNLRGGCRNKRKCAEPRKVADEVKRRLTDYRGTVVTSQVTNAYIAGQSVTGGGHDTGVFRGPSSLTPQDVSAYRGSPLIQLDTSPYRRSLTPQDSNPSSPFRPWSHQPLPPPTPSGYQPTVYYRIASPQQDTDQDQPLALVSKDKYHHDPRESQRSTTSSTLRSLSTSVQDRLQSSSVATFSQQGKSRPRPQDVVRLKREPETPEISVIADSRRCHSDNSKTSSHNGRSNGELTVEDLSGGKNGGRSFSVESLIGGDKHDVTFNNPSTSTSKKASTCHQTQQRNYKNMTRERRIEANARERTRVHTISAAFDTLRRAVPAYSHNQKLSKLSVLRIACSYILTLSRVAGSDYSADQSSPSLAECVDNVSKTIQMEGKLRKKKDE